MNLLASLLRIPTSMMDVLDMFLVPFIFVVKIGILIILWNVYVALRIYIRQNEKKLNE